MVICVRYLFIALATLLVACQPSNMVSVPDKELRQRNYKCAMASGLSPAEIQVCKNIRRECDERASKGNYVC